MIKKGDVVKFRIGGTYLCGVIIHVDIEPSMFIIRFFVNEENWDIDSTPFTQIVHHEWWIHRDRIEGKV